MKILIRLHRGDLFIRSSVNDLFKSENIIKEIDQNSIFLFSLFFFANSQIFCKMEKTEISDQTTPTNEQSDTSISTLDQHDAPSAKEATTTSVESGKEDNVDALEAVGRKAKIGRILTFIGLQIALFLGALDNTIVATALPRIGSDFNQMSIVAWVATAYILTFDAFQPLFAKFSDIFGRKWILLFGIAVFLFGSVLCGAAQSMIMLIVARAIAGIGAAGIFSMVFVIFSELVPLEKRGSYQG
ncbi:major facilitator superfamily domain-containing protein [Choanephora cucurbitarum]|nr:major facilitator superfamily domain-containing protein [Choanephora cucurbitarum]